MSRAALLGLLLGCALPTSAHIVSEGVGTQTEIRVTPRRVYLNYNAGFSALLGLGELTRMDTNQDGQVDGDEERVYVEELGKLLVGNLRLSVDGEALELRLVRQTGVGIKGAIQKVGFDTWYEFVAECDLEDDAVHVLDYREGNYEGMPAEQLLWLPTDRSADYTRFEGSQPNPRPTLQRPGAVRYSGRELHLELAFTGAALDRDRALALLEPSLDGLEAVSSALSERALADVAGELNALAFRRARFVAGESAPGIVGGAPLAPERQFDEETGEEVTAEDQGEQFSDANNVDSLTQSMVEGLSKPFSLWILCMFFGWGVVHGISPGHGKSMVAAYLLGTAGRVYDAFRLGAIVTFTHTFALYTVGLFLVYIVERAKSTGEGYATGQTLHAQITQQVTLASGLLVVAYGAWLFYSRRSAMKAAHWNEHSHGHDHAHGEGHSHDHAPSEGHSHDHGHDHAHAHGEGHSHDHGHDHAHAHGEGHSHAHGHDHANSHGEGHSHDHGHGEGHDHDHGHGEGHSHAHGHDHANSHGEGHSHDHGHGEGHDHDHAHGEGHSHDHGHGEGHDHDHGHAHDHAHDGHHHHAGMTEEEHAAIHAREAAQVRGWRDLIVLGVTGGLVPCPAGVLLILWSLTLPEQNTIKCFVYLVSFSLGLGAVLVAIAVAMVLTRGYLVQRSGGSTPGWLKSLPLVGAALIVLAGALIVYRAFDPTLFGLVGS